ncbi:MAG: alanine--tRNA ligase [Candidatus Omnitrophota bacterium]
MTADVLREKFLAFFEAKQHKIIDSDSLVPKDDPTVLFTPAGMNQFKKEFMGFDSGYKRAATSQRCLRTDDLDKVGKTSSHHTFFEMLGNFSFGDYFKEDAIAWAWEFLIQELKIDPKKLSISVYQDDVEAYSIWKDKIKIPQEKIVKLGDKDNFWPAEAKAKGPNGPCGPCSEIFYDFGPDTGCGEKSCDPSCSCGRFVEIWNLVFTQFNRKEDGSLEPLPNKNIDTGMGLERLTAVMQGKKNNFQTELFQPLIEAIKEKMPSGVVAEPKILYAISDHVRAVVFSIYDGISPSNEGRGYIVRKIIRKSVSHLRNLGINEPFLSKLTELVTQIMHKPYPDLSARYADIAQVIYNEEKNFIQTLNEAPVIYKTVFAAYDSTKAQNESMQREVSKAVFTLYDTHGIPLELTKSWLDGSGLKYDQAIIDAELNLQKDRSRAHSQMKGDVFDAKGLSVKLNQTKFVGYQESACQAKILAVLKNSQEVSQAQAGEDLQIVLDQTPFYAESGGQVGDTGELVNGENIFEVLDTQKIDNVFLHVGKIKSGVLKKTDTVTAKIDRERRLNIARNHTATHILQAALRQVLGNHVGQQGSLVSDNKFRFDFTHFRGLTKDELSRIEELVNNFISFDCAVDSQEMALRDAKKAGALAFFEEKYGEIVRVVAVGDISKELCGGTHLNDLKAIGLIKIISESSVASGIRRIEGVTAKFAEQFIKEQEQKAALESQKRNKLEEQKELQKKRNAEISSLLPDRSLKLINASIKLGSISTVFSVEDNLDVQALRKLADLIKIKLSQAVIVLGSKDQIEKKVSLVIAISQDLLPKGLDAGVLVRQIAPLIGGSGGGRKDFAQAGGTNPDNLTLAFDKLRDIINKLQ